MSKRIVCTICGRTVLTFEGAQDVDPEELFTILDSELNTHGHSIGEMGEKQALHSFQVVDEDNEAADLEEELETPELFYYGDTMGWW